MSQTDDLLETVTVASRLWHTLGLELEKANKVNKKGIRTLKKCVIRMLCLGSIGNLSGFYSSSPENMSPVSLFLCPGVSECLLSLC